MRRAGWLALALLGCAPSAGLVRPVRERADAPSCISRVRVFEGTGDALTAPLDVRLSQGRVESMSPATGTVGPGCVDGQGRTLLPGLVDSHVHVGLVEGLPPWDVRLPDPQRHLEALLYAGVTTALIPEGGDGVTGLAREVERGERLGPRLLVASRIFAAQDGHPAPMYRSGVGWPISALIIDERLNVLAPTTDIAGAVALELPRHPKFLKVVYSALPLGGPHLSPLQLQALVREGRQVGVPVVVHVGSAKEAVEAAHAGAFMLMHTPWEDRLSEEDVEALAASHVPVVTTLRIYEATLGAITEHLPLHPLERRVCPPGCDASYATRPKGFVFRGFDEGFLQGLPAWTANIGANLQALAKAGVTLVVGTDAGVPGVLQGASLHRELQALVGLGFSPAFVLRAATSVPAALLDPSRRFGVVEPGAVADLLLVDGDPLADITATERIVTVWKGGLELSRAPLGP